MLLLVVLAALGAAQAAFLLFLIAFRFRHHKNVPLALLLLAFSLRLATIPTWNPTVLLSRPWLFPATTPLPFLFGPLLWWYVREVAQGARKETKGLVLHFLPYLAGVAFTAFITLRMSLGDYTRLVQNVFAGNPPMWFVVENGLKVLVNLVYVGLAAAIAFGSTVSRLGGRRRIWIRALVVMPAVVLAAFSYVALFPGATAELAEGVVAPFAVLAVLMVALIYLVSLMVIVAPDMSFDQLSSDEKRGGHALSTEECNQLLENIDRLLESGELQDPDLSLPDIALQLKVHPNRLSYAVNRAAGLSFRRFVNRRRITYFLNMVESGALEESTILRLAFDAGFPSKSTFNRVFKEEVGVTPSEFVSRAGPPGRLAAATVPPEA